MNQEFINGVGFLAMCLALAMFVSYIDQIKLNLRGKTGSIWLPFMTILNCACWSFYGFFKTERDWNIVIPNFVGVIFGALTVFTALYYRDRGELIDRKE